MKVFLTGATGFIGRALTDKLLKRGWKVNALVRDLSSSRALSIKNAGAAVFHGDITKPQSMRSAMDDVDIVIHNAAWYELGVSKAARQAMSRINVQGTKNTLGLANELKVPRIVYTSTIGAFGPTCDKIGDENFKRLSPPVSYYEYTKTEAHAIATRLQDLGAPIIITCPSIVIGPGDHSPWGYFARLYVRNIMPPIGWSKDSIFTPAHVEDIAEAIALAAEKGQIGKTYILAGEATTMKEIFDIWNNMPGGFRIYFWLSDSIAKLVGAITGPLLRLIGQSAFLSSEVVRVCCENWHYNADAAVEELGAEFRSAEQIWQQTLKEERSRLKKQER